MTIRSLNCELKTMKDWIINGEIDFTDCAPQPTNCPRGPPGPPGDNGLPGGNFRN